MASAGRAVPHVFTVAVLDRVHIPEALVDTGSAFLIISAAMRERLPKPPPIQSFIGAAPDVVGVEGASAQIRGYINAPLELDGI